MLIYMLIVVTVAILVQGTAMEETMTIGEKLVHGLKYWIITILKSINVVDVKVINVYNNESLWLYVFAYNHHKNIYGIAISPFVSKSRTVNYKICGLDRVGVINLSLLENWKRSVEKIISREMPKDAARVVCIYFGMLFAYFKWTYITAPPTMRKDMRIREKEKFLNELLRELENKMRHNVQEKLTYNLTPNGIHIQITVMSVVHEYHITHKIVGSHYCCVMCYNDKESRDSDIVVLSWSSDTLVMTVVALLCLSAIHNKKWSYVATRAHDILFK